MKKVLWTVLSCALVVAGLAAGEVSSLSHILTLGRGLVDADGDGLADSLDFRIVVPDQPTAEESAAAADIAARANLESLAGAFDLVLTESEYARLKPAGNVILIGSRLKAVKDAWTRSSGTAFLTARQGAVWTFSGTGIRGLAVAAGSDEVLLRTARAFFLRWPYFWDIWGREEGATYGRLEADLAGFLGQEGLASPSVSLTRALYEFPDMDSPHEALKRLSFGNGEIRELLVEIGTGSKQELDKAGRALSGLAADRSRGLRSETLSYPGCGSITFRLAAGNDKLEVALPRAGYPKRLLTPAYKNPARPETRGKEFDLAGLFSTKAALGDTDQDGLPDNIESSLIVPQRAGWRSLADLTTRLVLSTAGASFPLVYLDKEVENPKSLPAPFLIGDSALTRALEKAGKLKKPALGPGQASAVIVPAAFQRSSALVVTGADSAAVDPLLGYLGRTFPYLSRFGKGNAQLSDVATDIDAYLGGGLGTAEAYFFAQLKKMAEQLKGKDLEKLTASFTLPRENPAFLKEAESLMKKTLAPKKVEVTSALTRSGRVIFDKAKDFSWEADDALALIRDGLKGLSPLPPELTIDAGLSESPEMRRALEARFEQAAKDLGVRSVKATVHSAYKQGFFWLLEDVLPALKAAHPVRVVVRWATEKDDLGKPKRFYSEPTRWLQELYPVDELLARDLGLPLDKIEFESADKPAHVYTVSAYDAKGAAVLARDFDPVIREAPYLSSLPEWGTVKIATGWLRMTAGDRTISQASLACDLEKFWTFYQDEVLAPVYAHILKKTGNVPLFSKQPFFKKLSIELWASEPDYRLGLDEERVSSLEAMHDEVYFDTLDFVRGITDIDQAEETLPEDTSRFSAPGNVMPVIHASREGRPAQVKVTFEEDRAAVPGLEMSWKEAGHVEMSRSFPFPALKPKTVSFPALVYDGPKRRLQSLTVGVEFDKEEAYGQLIDIIQASRDLAAAGLDPQGFRFPDLAGIIFRLKVKDLEKEEALPVRPLESRPVAAGAALGPGPVVPGGILSPDAVWDSVRRLEATGKVQAYAAGRSYEGRDIPVIEVRAPLSPYVSVPRLITFKPTLYLSGRQHANEVSSTSYILRLADLLSRDPAYAEYPRKINFVLHPVENPDGAALAFDLQKLTPNHSLHAGRYSALGLEIGYQTDAAKPILPEAKVRRDINAEWLPDIYLNLHGYPSHEWVQAFSNYSPFLFREYWIPKGWFAYFRSVTSPYYGKWREAGLALRKMIVDGMQSRTDIKESDKRFYARYARWATRWEPHLDPLELYDGLNLFVKRTSSQEVKPVGRTRTTYVEETPELMDETAQNGWFDFLVEQGLTYLKAHMDYLAATTFDILRLEEEVADRVRIQFFRSRPGTTSTK